MTDQIETAAIPSIVSVLQSLNTFITDMGTDPTQLPLRFPGALQKLVGSVQLQLPALASAELSAVQSDVQAKINALIAGLQKKAAV